MDQVIENKLVTFWKSRGSRRYFPWMFLVLSVAGSALKELQLMPDTYFNSSRNILNVYFVKLSWGWTLLLLTPFVLLSNSVFNRDVWVLSQRLLRLVIATAIWFIVTHTFFYIENRTGSCFQTQAISSDSMLLEFTSKGACRRAGFHWAGRDISGHSFILTYSALFIMEETAPMGRLRSGSLSAYPRRVLGLLYLSLNALVLLWVLMFLSTSLYFHNSSDKLLGTLCGLLGWYGTYGLLYPRHLSPGLEGPAGKEHP